MGTTKVGGRMKNLISANFGVSVLILLTVWSPAALSAATIPLAGKSGGMFVDVPTLGEFHFSAFTDASNISVLGFGGLFNIVSSGATHFY
jgi:hypothetical protein